MSVKGRCAMIATPLAGLPFGSPFEGATRRSLVGARTGWPENDARSSDGRSPLSAKADEREPVNTREPRLVYEAWGFLVKGTTREVHPTSPPRLFTVTHPTHRACSPTTTPRLGHRTPFPNAGGHERLGALCFNKRSKVAKLRASLPVLSPATVNKRGSFPQFSHTPTYQHFALRSLAHSFSIAEARHLLPPFSPQSRSSCTVSRHLASATSARQ